MPELPEVETMRRGILPIVGGRVEDVRAVQCTRRPILIEPSLATFRRKTRGQRIVDVERVGKRVVVRLESSLSIVFEPRMTGLVLLADPPSQEHLRLRVVVSGNRHEELLYWDRRGLGIVRLVTADEFEQRYGQDKLGPDALQLSAAGLQQRLASTRRAVKVALLDQRALAGVGNLYASEILHLAGVHPAVPCDRLRAAQWRKIHTSLREVLEQAIRHEGSTLSDGTYRNALNQAGSYQNYHRVYDRAGETCPTCSRGTIERIVQAQRSTFFCGRCQKGAGKLGSPAISG
jgi:formamidopyrimidine-DNA glycosylase